MAFFPVLLGSLILVLAAARWVLGGAADAQLPA
jgi:hypothetical protein